MTRRFFLLIPLVVLLLLAKPALAASRTAEIDPRVWTDLAGGPAHLIVRLQDVPQSPSIPQISSLLQDPATRQVASLRVSARSAQADLLAELQSLGVTYRAYWIVNAVALEAGPALVERLSRRTGVLEIESDRAFQVPLETAAPADAVPSAPPGPDTLAQVLVVEPGLDLVHAPALWAIGVRGQGMVVASADTGVTWNHPALQSQYRGWNGSTANHNYNWWDAIHSQLSSDPNICGFSSLVPCDDFGHGTHTIGTAVGSDGAANQIGMAPGAKWIACRNMDNGKGSPSTYIECLQFFLTPTDLAGNNADPALRPHVIDNSYSCPPSEGCQTNSLHDAVQQVRAAGIFMAVSTGNSGPACSAISAPPALEAGVFTVGGVGPGTQVYPASSRGPVLDNGVALLKPDLVAPAVSIRSSLSNLGYGSKTGTSMAAPHVAGGVALLWSAIPSLRRNLAATETLLRQTAAPLPVNETCGGLPALAVPNNTTGWGLLDVLAAYQKMTHNRVYLPAVHR